MTLDASRWAALQPLIDQALELEGAARAAFVAGLAQRDADSARELSSFLARAERAVDEAAMRAPDWLRAVQQPPGRIGSAIAGYRIEAELGRGGMGRVWRARAIDDLSRVVAIKLVEVQGGRDGALARFSRERDLLARLDHPHIARLLDAGFSDAGEPFLILEHIAGEPIDHWCARHAPDLRTRLRLLEQVADAVQAAHAQLIVHRDLKPNNLLVDAQGRAVVLDFGIARLLDPDRADAGLTHLHGAAMTPAYAAPEQLRGEPPSTAIDIYALGLIAYELVEGRRAFDTADAPREPVPLATRADADLATIIAKAMAFDRHERYASARDFADDLAAWREHRPIRARPPSLTYRARKFVRRHRGGVAAGMIALLAVIAGVVGTAWQARIAQEEAARAREAAARATAQSDFMSRLFGDALATGSNADALRLLERGQRLLAGFSDRPPRVRAELMMRWSLLLFSRDRPREALDLLEQAMALVQDDPAFVQNLRCRSIGMRLALGQSEVAAQILADAEHRAEMWPASVLAECFDRGATVQAERGDAARALASLDRAAAAYRERDGEGSVDAWRTLRRRAGLEIGLGRLADAERHLDAYLAFAEATHLDEDTALAAVHGERARLLRLQSRLPQALAAAQRELELRAARGPDDIYKAAPHANIANLLALLGQVEAARSHYAEAERIVSVSNTRTMAPAIWLGHARWLIAWGEFDAAAERLGRAEAALIAQHGATHPELARVAYLRSILRIHRGELEAGRADLAVAIERLRAAGPAMAMQLPRALTDQARFALAAGDAAAAIAAARAALVLDAPEYEREDTRRLLAEAERSLLRPR